MRFARQYSIFRGPVDAVPLVGVLFLLVIFMLLASLLYTPGVLIKFNETSGGSRDGAVTVTKHGEVIFDGKTNLVADLEQLRAGVLKNATNQVVRLQVETGADADLVEKVCRLFQVITVTKHGEVIFDGKTNLVADLEQLRADALKNATNQVFCLQAEPGANADWVEQVCRLFQVSLPDGGPGSKYLTGTDNPTVIVAVNFRGQCFFENRLVQEPELRTELRRHLQEAGNVSRKLTLVLAADRAASNEVIMRLYRLARDAGVSEVLLVGAPNPVSAALRPVGHD
jgi:biopolymer transport protein ExbD